jgi:hypothetical protein
MRWLARVQTGRRSGIVLLLTALIGLGGLFALLPQIHAGHGAESGCTAQYRIGSRSGLCFARFRTLII